MLLYINEKKKKNSAITAVTINYINKIYKNCYTNSIQINYFINKKKNLFGYANKKETKKKYGGKGKKFTDFKV